MIRKKEGGKVRRRIWNQLKGDNNNESEYKNQKK
jgi:hypothetical protein